MISNKVILIGRLTKAPEIRMTGDDKPVCNFSLAVDKPYNKEKDHPEATFVDCVAWNGSAKFIENYFHKGDVIGIEGRIDIRKWEDKDGSTRYKTEIICEQVNFIPGANKKTITSEAEKSDNDNVEPEDDDEFPFD